MTKDKSLDSLLIADEKALVEYLRDDTDDLSELQLLKRDADRGDTDAQFRIGRRFATGNGFPLDQAEAVRWYRKAADQGHVGAQINLGVCYATGKGIARDYGEAAKWFYRAARQGDRDAQFNLGNLYLHGKGVPLNYDRAARCFSLSARQGNKLAKEYLSRMPAKYRRKYNPNRNGRRSSCFIQNLLTALSSFAGWMNSRR